MTVSYQSHPSPTRTVWPSATSPFHSLSCMIMTNLACWCGGTGSSVPIYTTPLLRYRAWNMTACCLTAYWLGGGKELLHPLDTLLFGLLKGLSHEIDFKILMSVVMGSSDTFCTSSPHKWDWATGCRPPPFPKAERRYTSKIPPSSWLGWASDLAISNLRPAVLLRRYELPL